MAEILIPFIIAVSVAILSIYLFTCIVDRRNPVKFWHTHKWEEVYHEVEDGRRTLDLYEGPHYRKSLVIINQCVTCKRTQKTEDRLF